MYIDRNDQMCTYVYTVYVFIILYLHVIIVNYSLLAAVVCVCVSGTSEVHFRGLSLKRSARGAGWVVCVCINAVFGHVLIWTMEPWIVFILDSSLHRKPGSSTGTWKRDPKHRPCRFLMLFEHARAPSR